MLFDLGPLGQQTLTSLLLLGTGASCVAYVLYAVFGFLLSSWAVVTGASDGVGKEYALQIASKGFNLILASRTKSKLDALSEQITSKYSVKVETISIDFSAPTDQDYQKLSSLLESKQIAILINNVGQSHSIPVTFAETSQKEMENIININCMATLKVTQLVLPHMIPNKRGLILTMGSFGGLLPTPLLATYSGSKAFLQQWSTALASELGPSGITVWFIHAYLITSAMSKIRRSSWQIPSEKNFVRAALGKIGRTGGSFGYIYSGSPYWSHALVAFIMLSIFGPMSKTLLDFNRKMHVSIRNRALKKAAREAKKQ